MRTDIGIEEVRKRLSELADGVPYKMEANEGIIQALQDGLIAAFIDTDGVLKFVRVEDPTKKVEWGFDSQKLRIK